MNWTPQSQNDYIKNHLGPRLRADHPEVLILMYDHNKGNIMNWVNGILDDPDAAQFVAGTAFHW